MFLQAASSNAVLKDILIRFLLNRSHKPPADCRRETRAVQGEGQVVLLHLSPVSFSRFTAQKICRPPFAYATGNGQAEQRFHEGQKSHAISALPRSEIHSTRTSPLHNRPPTDFFIIHEFKQMIRRPKLMLVLQQSCLARSSIAFDPNFRSARNRAIDLILLRDRLF